MIFLYTTLPSLLSLSACFLLSVQKFYWNVDYWFFFCYTTLCLTRIGSPFLSLLCAQMMIIIIFLELPSRSPLHNHTYNKMKMKDIDSMMWRNVPHCHSLLKGKMWWKKFIFNSSYSSSFLILLWSSEILRLSKLNDGRFIFIMQ